MCSCTTEASIGVEITSLSKYSKFIQQLNGATVHTERPQLTVTSPTQNQKIHKKISLMWESQCAALARDGEKERARARERERGRKSEHVWLCARTMLPFIGNNNVFFLSHLACRTRSAPKFVCRSLSLSLSLACVMNLFCSLTSYPTLVMRRACDFALDKWVFWCCFSLLSIGQMDLSNEEFAEKQINFCFSRFFRGFSGAGSQWTIDHIVYVDCV